MSEPKILFFDLESTNLDATFGTILTIGWKWFGKPRVTIPTILDAGGRNTLDDHALVKQFAAVYATADYSVGWYSGRFDLPMIRTKLLKFGEPPLAPIPHVDLWRTARYQLKLHSNRLAVVQEYLKTTHSKTPIHYDDWLQAAIGDKKALNRVREHCRLDVVVLEEVFVKLRPLIKDEPNRGLVTGETGIACQSCGSKNLERRGESWSLSRVYQRWQCRDCGKWAKSVKSEPRAKLMLRNSGGG